MRDRNFDPDLLFRALLNQGVDFIVIGGIARVFHGSARPTLDADLMVRRDRTNLARLAAALNSLNAQLLAGSEVLAISPEAERFWMGMNFSWSTDAGQVDTFGEVEGGFRYEDLLPGAETVETAVGGVRVASLEQLTAMKRPLGRPKDRQDLDELEELARLRAELPAERESRGPG